MIELLIGILVAYIIISLIATVGAGVILNVYVWSKYEDLGLVKKYKEIEEV